MENEIEEMLEEVRTKVDFLLSDRTLNFDKFMEVESIKKKAEKLSKDCKEEEFNSIINDLKQMVKTLNIILVENNFQNVLMAEV